MKTKQILEYDSFLSVSNNICLSLLLEPLIIYIQYIMLERIFRITRVIGTYWYYDIVTSKEQYFQYYFILYLSGLNMGFLAKIEFEINIL